MPVIRREAAYVFPRRAHRPLVLSRYTKFAPFPFLFFTCVNSGGADLRV